SSTNTRWAPRRTAFFYPRPFFAGPARDRVLVALDGTPLGLLATPAQGGQDLPDVGGMIAHAELLVDQFGHARQRPQLGSVPRSHCATGQQPHQLPFLCRRQPWRTSRDRFRLQAPGPLASIRLPPAKHRTHGGSALPRHGRETLARLQQLNSPATALLQLLGRTRRSHEPSCNLPLDTYALFMQGSIRSRVCERSCSSMCPTRATVTSPTTWGSTVSMSVSSGCGNRTPCRT